ncbi:hypothetical protein GFS24_03600 [Chitinophaga sp. SYP-B3965]|uniref:hypothetical protein n=1 Tax=Chitinophaga sp. SYP-B3965 TaxID=2663120 RepID=UPI001299B6D5|nr:hypothetical protein [Chitinophaga sp. SYP-B3965]MRG44181.1 hypothetical protein [Chitinophaga sp. SYP-B3965]
MKNQQKRGKEKMAVISIMARTLLLLIIMMYGACAEAQVINYDGCKLAKAVKFDMKFVSANARKIISKSEDECVIALLDTLTARVIRTGNNEYFACLDAFATAGDGYVAEYFLEIGIKVFYKRFREFFIYTYDAHMKKGENALERVMVQSISMQIWIAGNKKAEEKEINAHMDKEIKKGVFNASQLQYLALVRKKIDPSIFD